MKFSEGFFPTEREAPKNAASPRKAFAEQAGYWRRPGAFLPLGVKSLSKMSAPLYDRPGWCSLAVSTFEGRSAVEQVSGVLSHIIRSYRELPRIFFTKSPDGAAVNGLCVELVGGELSSDVSAFVEDLLKNLGIGAVPGFTSRISPTGAYFLLEPTGATELLYCEKCGKAGTPAATMAKGKLIKNPVENPEEVHTPGVRTIEQVSEFFKFPADRFAKSLLMMTSDGRPVLAVVRGDDSLSILKLSEAAGSSVRTATPEEVFKFAGVEPGFVGPRGHEKIPIYIDALIENSGSYIVGAGKSDFHARGIVPGRDFKYFKSADIREAKPGDACPECGAALSAARGEMLFTSSRFIPDRNIQFAIGYSNGFNIGGAHCEGWLVAFEINFGEILFSLFPKERTREPWALPASAAPFDAHVIILNVADAKSVEIAGRIEAILKTRGVEYVLDDRDYRSSGEKFNDADLFGIPLRIIIGKKKAADGIVEIRKISGVEMKTSDVKISEIETNANLFSEPQDSRPRTQD